jgi:hypothetical protein
MTPEAKARVSIDALLQQAGWHVCNMADANIHASTGVANLKRAQSLRQATLAKAFAVN